VVFHPGRLVSPMNGVLFFYAGDGENFVPYFLFYLLLCRVFCILQFVATVFFLAPYFYSASSLRFRESVYCTKTANPERFGRQSCWLTDLRPFPPCLSFPTYPPLFKDIPAAGDRNSDGRNFQLRPFFSHWREAPFDQPRLLVSVVYVARISKCKRRIPRGSTR